MEVAVPAHCSRVALMIGQERRSSAAWLFCGGNDDTPDQTFSWIAGRRKRGGGGVTREGREAQDSGDEGVKTYTPPGA